MAWKYGRNEPYHPDDYCVAYKLPAQDRPVAKTKRLLNGEIEAVGGYECKFVDAVHPDDYCVACKLPAQDPQQTKCECAKLYCKSCYDQYNADHSTTARSVTAARCPTCGQKLDAFPDKRTAKRIKDYKIKCTATNCPWVNQLKLLDDHLTTCEYVIVPCANAGCTLSTTRNNALTHQTKECLFRPHTCEHCKAKGTFMEMTGAHINKCPDYVIPCPNKGCNVKIKRKETNSHRSMECLWEIIPCCNAGCTVSTTRNNALTHQTKECLFRPYTCEHCKANGVFNEMTGPHINKCPDYLIPCPNRGCEMKIKRKETNSHRSVQCLWEIINCCNAGCTLSTTRNNALTHQTKECLFRPYTCEHCKANGIFMEMTGPHINKCPDYLIPCPNSGCAMKIKRKETVSHRLVDCLWEIMDCPYLHIGCMFKCPKCKMVDHKATSSDYHLELSVKELMIQREQLKKQKEQHEEQKKQFMAQNEQLISQRDQFSKQQTELTKSIIALEYEKPHWITMVGFNRFKVNSTPWYSEGFYTHLHGYKLCLRVDANGHDEGVGKYVSIYLCLTEGDFDANLTWPMNCECTITLLNQVNDDDHHSGTFTLTIYGMHDPQMVMLEGENGRQRGYHRFIAHHLLDQHMFKHCRYLMNDTLRFKVQVKIIFH